MEELQLQDLQNIEAIVSKWQAVSIDYVEGQEGRTRGRREAERKSCET
jgi:hypothetical protein